MDFESLLLATTPGAALWLQPRGWLAYITTRSVPKLLADSWHQQTLNKRGSKEWLAEWVSAAAAATRRNRRQEFYALTALSLASIISNLAVPIWFVNDPSLCLKEFVIILTVDFALILADPSPTTASLLLIYARLPFRFTGLCFGVRCMFAALPAGLRLALLALRNRFQSELNEINRNLHLQEVALLSERPPFEPPDWRPGRRTMSSILVLALLWSMSWGEFLRNRPPPPVPPPPAPPPPPCACQFPYVFEGRELDHCTMDGDSQPWCFVHMKAFTWGYCDRQGLKGDDVLGYQGTFLCPPAPAPKPTVPPMAQPSLVRFAWCCATSQERVAMLSVPVSGVFLGVFGSYEALRQNRFHMSLTVGIFAVVSAALCSAIEEFLLFMDCTKPRWGLAAWDYLRFQRVMLGKSGIILYLIHYSEWRRRGYRAARLPISLGILSLVLMLVESPFGVRLFDAFFLIVGAGFSVWTSFFGLGCRFSSLALANVVVMMLSALWIGVHFYERLLMPTPDQEYWTHRLHARKRMSWLFATAGAMSPIMVFGVALKARQLSYESHMQGAKTGEDWASRTMHTSLEILALLALGGGGLLAVLVQVAAPWVLVFLGIALGHLVAMPLHLKFVVAPEGYPNWLKNFWVGLFVACTGQAAFMGAHHPSAGIELFMAAAQAHLLVYISVVHSATSWSQLRALQGPFCHGIRWMGFVYHEYEGRVWPLSSIPRALMLCMLTGMTWSILVFKRTEGLDGAATWGCLHPLLLVVWHYHGCWVCSAFSWAVVKKPTWAAKEAERVFCVHHNPDHTLVTDGSQAPHQRLQHFLKERGQEIGHMEAVASRGGTAAAEAYRRLEREHEKALCGILEWEMRMGQRLERAANREAERIETAYAQTQATVTEVPQTAEELLLFPEEAWFQLNMSRKDLVKAEEHYAMQHHGAHRPPAAGQRTSPPPRRGGAARGIGALAAGESGRRPSPNARKSIKDHPTQPGYSSLHQGR